LYSSIENKAPTIIEVLVIYSQPYRADKQQQISTLFDCANSIAGCPAKCQQSDIIVTIRDKEGAPVIKLPFRLAGNGGYEA
jgi:hypothetical protein